MPRPRALCPACEYDLSGVVASWQDCCPLEGVCSECGAAVRWADVLVPKAVPWLVEHPGRLFPRRVMGTWLRALLPWRFWRPVGAATAGSAWRLVMSLPVLVIGLHITKALLANAARLIVHSQQGFNPRLWAIWASDDWTQPLILIYYNWSPVIRVINTQWQLHMWPSPVWGLLAASAAAPIALWGVGVLMNRDDIRSKELVRGAWYGLAWIPAFWALGVIDAAWRLIRCASGAAAGLDVDGWDVEWLFGGTWRLWGRWVWLPAAWWCVWWWNAVIRGVGGVRGTPDRDLAAVVVGSGVAAGVLTTAAVEVLRW